MTKSDKPRILDPDKKHAIASAIDTTDYVTMHKAQIRSLVDDDTALKWGAALFDKFGTFILGVSATAYFGIEPLSKPYVVLIVFCAILGLLCTGYGLFLSYRRNSKITFFVDSVLKEKDAEIKLSAASNLSIAG